MRNHPCPKSTSCRFGLDRGLAAVFFSIAVSWFVAVALAASSYVPGQSQAACRARTASKCSVASYDSAEGNKKDALFRGARGFPKQGETKQITKSMVLPPFWMQHDDWVPVQSSRAYAPEARAKIDANTPRSKTTPNQ